MYCSQPFSQSFKGAAYLNCCARWKCFIVCGLQCHSSSRYVIFMEHKISALSTRLHKHLAFHEDWIWLDSEKDGDLSTYVFAESELATRSISGIDELCDDCDGGGRSGEKR
jgi:hypothetical protein